MLLVFYATNVLLLPVDQYLATLPLTLPDPVRELALFFVSLVTLITVYLGTLRYLSIHLSRRERHSIVLLAILLILYQRFMFLFLFTR